MSKINDWVKNWDKACEEQVFGKLTSRLERTNESLIEENEKPNPKNPCSKYWKMLYEMSRSPKDTPDIMQHPLVLGEMDRSDAAKIAANTSNPVFPDTLGSDRDVVVAKNWTSGDELDELIELKKKIHELESKITTLDVEGKSSESVQKQIDKLKKKINDISNEITNISVWDENDPEDKKDKKEDKKAN